jgi:hypothetical protein
MPDKPIERIEQMDLVPPGEVGETKWTGRGRMVGAPAPTTDMQQPTRPHDPDPNPPEEAIPEIADPQMPTQEHSFNGPLSRRKAAGGHHA